jgi:hypothetical protein
MVICDGSGFDFYPYVQIEFPDVEIECLNFTNDTIKTRERGKGYGEGEIINYAISNSFILSESEYFSKCTSKYWVENYLDCVGVFNGYFNCDFNYVSHSLCKVVNCDTKFFIVKIEYYNRYLGNCYQTVDDFSGYFLENAFFDIIYANKLRGVLIKISPRIYGFQGSSGQFYMRNKEGLLARFFRKLRRIIFIFWF